MAETKYDLLLVPTLDNSRIKQQPWYRERLKTKYCKPQKKKEWTPTFTTSAWMFIQDGIDDFRDGTPPEIDESIFLKGEKGLLPSIIGSNSRNGSQPKQRIIKSLTNEEKYFLRSLPQQNRKRERVQMMEKSLLDHPLALYEHLEESVPSDVFEDIVELLDPALNLSETGTEIYSDTQSEADSDQMQESLDGVLDENGTSKSSFGYNGLNETKRNTYKWLPSPEESPKEERTIRTSKKKPDSPSQEKKIEGVTQEFCGWVRDLGGDTNNIEESTIYSLFASGYETKPALSVPLHVVELTNVPPELRSGTISQTQGAEEKKMMDTIKSQKYTPSWVKVKYGAWYLNPKTWKARSSDEPLQDPKELEGNRMSESKQKGEELDKVLSVLHGARAFKDFVEKKGGRKPEFLDSVSQQIEASNHGRGFSSPPVPTDDAKTSKGRTSTMGSRRRADTSYST